MTPRQLSDRRKYLPRQLAATRLKLQMLEREAERLGLGHLVAQQCADQAQERAA